ncbi:MAG TPA: hypothetical protein VG099_14035 [Gemmataceae bacterium]|nr:hypothetical protein [Gemmataceae bacterium]
MASQLLHCITSITPRARYFSFLPWSVFHFQSREKGKPFALGLYDAIILREQALTLACLAHHDGEPCTGGRLVGSRDGRKWYFKGEKQANLRKIKKFAQSPAWGAYFNSLVNLGFFVTDQQLPDTDEQTAPQELTFDDIELSELGLDLATRYEAGVGTLAITRQIAAKERSCTVTGLAEFGKYGGLCELTDGQALDRELLQDIFFDLVHAKGEAHVFRRRSLLLILEICRQFSAENWLLDDDGFAGVVYFGEVANDEDRKQVRLPAKLQDIATRWRIFYFHHFMGVALEGLFSWLVSQPAASELPGTTVESLVARLDEKAVRKRLSELLQVSLTGSFGDWTPARLYATQGIQGDDLDTRAPRGVWTRRLRGPLSGIRPRLQTRWPEPACLL